MCVFLLWPYIEHGPGNFYRIRGAFKYGARKLGQILLLPRARIANEIKKFFSNTLERHLQKSSDLSSLSPSFEEEVQLNLVDLDLDNNIPGLGNSELYRSSTKDNSMKVVSKMACSTDGSSVSGSHLDGEVSSRIISDTSDCSPSKCDLSDSLSGIHCYPPKFSLSGSSGENGKLEMFCEEWLDEKMGFDSWIVVDEKTGSDPCMGHRSNNFGASRAVCSCTNHHDGLTSSFSGILSPDATISEALAFDFRESDSIDIAGSLEAFNLLSDLSGDYDSHIRSLLYGQCCHGYALYAPTLPNAPTFPSHLQKQQNKRPWNTVRQSMPIKQGSHMTTNGVVLGSTYNSMNDSKPFNCLRSEEKRKARGTGTFFPKSELVLPCQTCCDFRPCASFYSQFHIISDLTHEICRMVVHAGRGPHRGGERSRHRAITVRSRDMLVSMVVDLPCQRRSRLRKGPVRFHVVGSLD